MQSRQKIRIGDLLLAGKLITPEALENALAEQKKSGHKLGRVLVESGCLSEDQLLEFLSRQLQIPFVDLRHFQFDTETVVLIPQEQARRFRAIALRVTDHGYLVGMADPTNLFACDELATLLKRPIEVAVVREGDLLRAIEAQYRQLKARAVRAADEPVAAGDLQALRAGVEVTEAPAVEFLRTLLEDTVRVGASAIHIEPDESAVRIRRRADGVLRELVLDEMRIAVDLVPCLRQLAGLDGGEKRMPQNGRFSLRVKDRALDLHVATLPVVHGEAVVVRLGEPGPSVRSLEALGLDENLRARFASIVRRPQGLTLIAGPAESGKTTTVYAALGLLNVPEIKIVTVEDPVEYAIPNINQVEVRDGIGLNFPRAIRAALRQDPNVLLVGESPDRETAESCLHAALMGRMVLACMHARDAVSAVERLLDMLLPAPLLAAAIQAIVAQRLVRRICAHCAEPAPPDPRSADWVRALDPALVDAAFRHGRGCQHCNLTGFSGRVGVYELLELNEVLAAILSRGKRAEFSAAARRTAGYRPLDRAALDLAARGVTTLGEAMRVSAAAG